MKKLFSRTLILGALVGCMATAAWAGNVEVGPDGRDIQYEAEGYYTTRARSMETKDIRFDKNGNVVEETNVYSNGSETTYKYAYDADNNLIRMTSGGSTFKYSYDDQGRLVCVKDIEEDYIWRYDYKYTDDTATVEWWTSDYDYPIGIDTSYYDENGNIVKYESKRFAGTDSVEYTTMGTALYGYDADGNLVTVETTYGGGQMVAREVLEYENGLCVKLNEIDENGENERWTTFEYDSNGNMVRSETSDGRVETYEYAPIPGPAASKFSDVQEVAQYYYDPVIWATDKKITDGTGDGNFTPGGNCTRAQMVTFLWRAAGSPEPKNAENPFEDVSNNTWYTKAVQWAVENGITTGASDTKFDPNGKCTRAQIVTFLWRAAGQQQPETAENPFEDVASDAYYKNAVLWAVENGITTGTAATRFAPKGICTRGQGVTFLYRAADLLG